jgi:hypothetical protein
MFLAAFQAIHAAPFFALLPCCFFVFVGFFALAAGAFWIWMIVDCATNEPGDAANSNTKVIWILVIVLAHWLGALIYFLVRRPERKRLFGK